jgi:hypothetical protein
VEGRFDDIVRRFLEGTLGVAEPAQADVRFRGPQAAAAGEKSA